MLNEFYKSFQDSASKNLPGGGRARICTKRDTYPDGREFVGFGIQPDFKVEQTIDDYLEDKDATVDFNVVMTGSGDFVE